MRPYTLAAMADLVSQWVLIRDPTEASTHLSPTQNICRWQVSLHIQTQLEIEILRKGSKLEPMISKLSSCVCEYECVGAFGSPNPSRISLSSCQWPMTRRSCHLISWIPPLPHLSGGILRHTRYWEGGEGDLNRLLMTDGLQGYFLIMTHLSGRLLEICVRTLGAIGQNKAIWSVWLSLLA